MCYIYHCTLTLNYLFILFSFKKKRYYQEIDIDGRYLCGSGRNGWKDSPIAIFQLYHGEQFSWWKKPEYSERTTNHRQTTGELYHVWL
jgi:hypothetical protein